MTSPPEILHAGDRRDDGVVEQIVGFLTAPEPRSFFLFAGAGSGKTHTIREVLVRITGLVPSHASGLAFAQRSRDARRQVAVVTYTKNAVEEIEHRLGANPLVAVSTIHSFCWRLIEGFNSDIRDALVSRIDERIRTEDCIEVPTVTRSGNRRNSAAIKRDNEKKSANLSRLRARRDALLETERFTYSPDQERFGSGALTHVQVLETTITLLKERPTLARILVDRHPIVLVDESQDTTKVMLHALLQLERDSDLCLGLVGDHRQRIYMDGEQTLPQIVPGDWARPVLQLNRRCPHRVVKLINDVWTAGIDGRTEIPEGGIQYALSTRPVGAVRLYLGESQSNDKPAGERACAEDIACQLDQRDWSDHKGGYKVLVLEHQLAADREGFGELYRRLHRYDPNSAKDGHISVLNVLSNVLLPLSLTAMPDGNVDAGRERDALANHAPLLAAPHLATLEPEAQKLAFKAVRNGARKLQELWHAGDPTLWQLLHCARDSNLVALDPKLEDAIAEDPGVTPSGKDATRTELLAFALQVNWSEYVAYRQYVDGLTTHATHQGVKGSEFDRVLVVVDDAAAAGNQFAYEKIFGAGSLSETDRQNQGAGKETTIDRTLRLLYVTCSRAKESLAIVLWTSSPEAVRKRVLELGWFADDEIRAVPLASVV